jgi:hypothetical protein
MESNAPPVAPCGRYITPPGTVAIEFRIGGGPTAPDWSKATTKIGDQPAFGPEKWGPLNAAGAEEGYTWSARMQDRATLGIDASLNGPGLPELRTAMNRVLDSITITPP